MKKILLHITIIVLGFTAEAQDPHFSQFFMAQQLMNPASVGTTSEGWRISSNYRKQWGNAGTPISTATVGMDWKMKSFISLGAGLLYRYQYDYINLDFGVSAFHVNKPEQTYVQDENQVIPIRLTSLVKNPQSFEFSLLLRQPGREKGILYCPWR